MPESVPLWVAVAAAIITGIVGYGIASRKWAAHEINAWNHDPRRHKEGYSQYGRRPKRWTSNTLPKTGPLTANAVLA